MRVLFITKEWLFHERMGIMCLSSSLKQRGYLVRMAIVDKIGMNNVQQLVEEFSPQIICFSAMTGEYPALLELNKKLKERFEFISVFGGPHATFFPDIIYDDGIDAVCIGEGDIALPAFCRRVDESADFWKAPNFRVKYKQEVFENRLLPLVEDLDQLPFADRDIMYTADQDLLGEGRKMFFGGRGCPYHCTYCFNERYNEIYRGKGNVIRYRSPQNLIHEIIAFRKAYPVDYVWIADDNFLVKPREWFEKFAVLYKEKVSLPFSINLRANNVNNKIISLLKEAGLDSAWMGVECGNQDVANSILKRHLPNQQILEAAGVLHKNKIKFMTENILGLPVADPYAVDLQTLDFNLKLKPTLAIASLLYPFPETPVRKYAIANSFLKEDASFLQTSKCSTMLGFSVKLKRRIENLQKLFPIIVRFPVLRRFTDILTLLPLRPVYLLLFYFWYGYIQKFKIYSFHSVTRELGAYVRFWWSFLRKT
ncbi:MAG: radical SAM protein [Candidatus Omnitrophica bacterium]|nr:radical SAM protein [Candidatus Omnitrophota bacterium]